MNIKTLLVACALSLGSVGAQAATTALNNGNALTFDSYLLSGVSTGSSISDVFTFNLGSTGGVSGLTSLKLSPNIVVGQFTYALYSGMFVEGNTVDPIASGDGKNDSFSAVLSSGSYYLSVVGEVVGKDKTGSYFGTLTVSPVPEPGEWAMMLAGLGLLGVIARRRSAN